jgi:hypothetical protein
MFTLGIYVDTGTYFTSSKMWHHMARYKFTDVSEENIASLFRVKE